MHFKPTICFAGAFVTLVAAHGIVTEFTTDGTTHPGFPTDYIYRIQNGNPVPDLAAWSTSSVDRGYIEPNNMKSLDINCHVDAEPGALTASVAAGGEVGFFWADWPHNVGPVLTYIAACNGDCASADKSALKWVKIDEAGFDGEWAGQKLMDNNFTWTTVVPSTIAAGNYVFRNEIINLHSGAEANGAQLYPQCVNIEITGAGTDNPEGVLGVDLYNTDDAGILFDPYDEPANYVIPGPDLYTGGTLPVTGNTTAELPTSSNSINPTVATSSNTVTVTSETAAVISTSAAVVSTAASTGFSTSTRSAPGSRTRTLGSRTRTLGARPTSGTN